MDTILMILEITLTPGVHLSMPWGYVLEHVLVYDHNSQTGVLVYIPNLG